MYLVPVQPWFVIMITAHLKGLVDCKKSIIMPRLEKRDNQSKIIEIRPSILTSTKI